MGENAIANKSDQKDRVRRYSHITLVGSIASIGGSILFASVSPLSGFIGLVGAYRILFLVSAVMLVASLASISMLTEEKRPKKTTKVMKSSSIRYSARMLLSFQTRM